MEAKDIRIIVGCEESQTICKAFRELGFQAYSCDLKPCSGGHPEWHFQEDMFGLIKRMKFHAGIFHPDCTYLTNTGNKWLKDQTARKSGALVGQARRDARERAIKFFMDCYNADIEDVAVENPVGIMGTVFRKADQYVHPYQFGDPHSKNTGWWLRGFPKLIPTKIVEPEMYVYKDGRKDPMWHVETMHLPAEERSRMRSITFPGMAAAIAYQWGDYLLKKHNHWMKL